MFQTGLVSISFRNLSPKQVIEAAVDAGLTWIEWGSDVHAPCHDISRLEDIVQMQKDSGVSCSSYGTYFHIGKNTPEELGDYIQAAKVLGTNILRLWCGSKGSADYTPEEREAFYKQCRALARIAEDAGVILCMESHNNTMTDRAEAAYALMQAVNSPAFRMFYQPNQYRTREENVHYAKLLAPYTYHIHVFNWQGDNRYSLEDGISIWKEYLSCFTADRVLLLEFMPDNCAESLSREVSALKKIIGEEL